MGSSLALKGKKLSPIISDPLFRPFQLFQQVWSRGLPHLDRRMGRAWRRFGHHHIWIHGFFFLSQVQNLFLHRERRSRTRRGKRQKALSILQTQEQPSQHWEYPADIFWVTNVCGIRDICTSAEVTFYSTSKGGLRNIPSHSDSWLHFRKTKQSKDMCPKRNCPSGDSKLNQFRTYCKTLISFGVSLFSSVDYARGLACSTKSYRRIPSILSIFPEDHLADSCAKMNSII